MKPVIRETPRLHPPGTLIVKEARQSTMVSGYYMSYQSRLQTTVLINICAMGRYPTHFSSEDCNPKHIIEERQLFLQKIATQVSGKTKLANEAFDHSTKIEGVTHHQLLSNADPERKKAIQSGTPTFKENLHP